MPRYLLLLFIVTGIFAVQSMAEDKPEVNPSSVKSSTGDERDEVPDQPVMSPSHSSSSPSSSKSSDESKAGEAPEIRRLGKHHSSDKSVAGGGVIIGGLVTAILAAVFCYIRITRKRNAES